MGRVRKYANAEEAHQAKLKQMRENYAKRKAEREKQKAEAIAKGESPPPKPPAKPRKKNITWDDIPMLWAAIQKYIKDDDSEEYDDDNDNDNEIEIEKKD